MAVQPLRADEKAIVKDLGWLKEPNSCRDSPLPTDSGSHVRPMSAYIGYRLRGSEVPWLVWPDLFFRLSFSS